MDPAGDTYNFNAEYLWGPNGRPIIIGHTPVPMSGANPINEAPSNTWVTQTLHWDGDSLFFTSDSNGIETLELDTLGTIQPLEANPSYRGLYVNDYDLTGTLAGQHQTSNSDLNYLGSQALPPSLFQVASISGAFYINMYSTDSITDGLQTIQGVRTVEADVQQWSTPDAYAGNVGDPMSQKPYMWDRNNPYSYHDPSGYIWTYIDPALTSIIDQLSRGSSTFRQAFTEAANSSTSFTIGFRPASDPAFTSQTVPGHPSGLSAATEATPDGRGGIASASISIAAPDDKTDMTAGVAGEVFNAGRIAADPAGFLKGHAPNSDKTYGNRDEHVGDVGKNTILMELNSASDSAKKQDNG
jgi:hypothetical protein